MTPDPGFSVISLQTADELLFERSRELQGQWLVFDDVVG
jgi:hypothetical protein